MEKQTSKPPVLAKRKNPISSHQANITFEELFRLFEKECKIKDLAGVTVDGYAYAYNCFVKWHNAPLTCGDITQDVINDYILYLTECYKPQTVNSYQFKLSPIVKFSTSVG